MMRRGEESFWYVEGIVLALLVMVILITFFQKPAAGLNAFVESKTKYSNYFCDKAVKDIGDKSKQAVDYTLAEDSAECRADALKKGKKVDGNVDYVYFTTKESIEDGLYCCVFPKEGS